MKHLKLQSAECALLRREASAGPEPNMVQGGQGMKEAR
jgi:hypothetical protein